MDAQAARGTSIRGTPESVKIVNVYGAMDRMHGATKYVMAFATELRRQGHDSSIVCSSFRIPKPYWLEADVVESRKAHPDRVPTDSRVRRAAARLLDASPVARRVEPDADVVVLHSEHALPSLPFVRRRCPRAVIAYYCYQPPREAYDLWNVVKKDFGLPTRAALAVVLPIYRLLDKTLARASDRVLVFSPEYRAYARSIYGDLDYLIVPAGIDFQMFDVHDVSIHEVRRRIRGEADHMLLMVAALTRKKNVDRFVRLLAALRDRGLDVRGTVLGEGPLEAELTVLARELGVEDHLVLTGFVTQEDLPAYHHAADVLLYLEPGGAWTMSILEAGAAGVPVIVAPGGSIPTLVEDGVTGFVLNAADDEGELLQRTLALLGDPGLRARMGEANRKHSAGFSLQTSVHAFAAAMEALV